MIAALFVEKNGAYFGLDGVDPWDEERDARKYPGPHPVVAHPPCSRWCRLAGLVEARWGHKRGEDGGCFESALRSVRTWGGVLEHPAYSDAWNKFLLPVPTPGLGWQRGICGGWSCHVEQGRYGHPAKKATWLYAHSIGDPPSLDWRTLADNESTAVVSWCGNRTKARAKRPMVSRMWREAPRGDFDVRPRLSKKQASATPPAFKEVLLSIARAVKS